MSLSPEDALDAVFASAHPEQWYEVLEAFLQDGHAGACAQPTPIERMQAHWRHFLWYDDVCSALTTEAAQRKLVASGLRLYAAGTGTPAISDAEFLTLLRHQSGLVKRGFENNRALRARVRQQYRDRVRRQDLGDERCGTYPYRHADHGPVFVRSAPALSRPSRSGIRYPFAEVEPFVRESLSEDERAALQQARLRVRTLTADDLLTPDEHALIGQRGVFARTDIPAGTCLGVYGGQILDPLEMFLLEDCSYIFKASDEPGRTCVNGETMMSLVNTRFLFDRQGRTTGHPRTGYNVEEAAFPVRMSDQREMLMHVYFALTPIAAGTELRICYHLGSMDGSSVFAPAEPEPARPPGPPPSPTTQPHAMTPQDTLDLVFASEQPQHWYEALETLLQNGYEEACEQPTDTDRMHAHRRHFLWFDDIINALATQDGQQRLLAAGLRRYMPAPTPEAPSPAEPVITREEFMELLQHLGRLVKSGCESSKSLCRQVRQQYHDRVRRQDRGDALCGTYPFRHADLGDVHVDSAAPLSSASRSGTRYAYADVEPFVRVDLSQEERAALYQTRLRVQTLAAEDLQDPGERELIGQRGVFARTPIPAGVCLGVYGGLILDPVDTFLLGDYGYMINASDEPGQVCVNGETMMSLVNTRFLFDAQGKTIGHPDTGYNVEEASFHARMAGGREMVIYAFFSTTDIAPGTELRICYELGRLNGESAFSQGAQGAQAAQTTPADQAQPA